MKGIYNSALKTAAAAGLALALAFGGASAGAAYGATTRVGSTGSITVSEGVDGTYYAYKLFDGTFEDFDEDGATVTKLGDAVINESYKAAILNALQQMAASYDGTDFSDGSNSYYPDLYDTDGSTELSARTQADAILDKFMLVEENDRMRTFANLLAYVLEIGNYAATTSATCEDGVLEFDDLNCGYWLVAQSSTTPTSDGADVDSYAMTTALLIAVDGDESVEAKVTVPTVAKFVTDDDSGTVNRDTDEDGTVDLRGDGQSGKTADAGATTDYTYDAETGEISAQTAAMSSISYEVIGTVASNIADYETYQYIFHDQLPEVISFAQYPVAYTDQSASATYPENRLVNTNAEGEAYDVWSITVEVADTTIDATGYFTPTWSATAAGITTVSWSCADITQIFEDNGIAESEWAGAVFTLWYNFELTEDEIADYLAQTTTLSIEDAETNYVYIEYSNNPYTNNPVTNGEGTTSETPEDENRVYSFNLQITKLGEDGEALSGATFTLTREVEDESGATSTVDAGYLIVDDESGIFTFTGLEADVEYTLTETRVPSGHKSIDPITFTITAHVSSDGYSYEYLTVDPEATDDPSGAATISTVRYAADGASLAYDATVYISVVNVEGFDVPLTGAAGVAAGIGVGMVVIAVSAWALVQRDRRAGGAAGPDGAVERL